MGTATTWLKGRHVQGQGVNGETPVFPDERQSRIVELVASNGKVYVPQLAKLFDVTEATLRKDLNTLEQKGLLKRTHGGAISVQPGVEQAVATRHAHHATAKSEIAKACVELVNFGEAIFLDCRTTVHEIARHLVSRWWSLWTTARLDWPTSLTFALYIKSTLSLPIFQTLTWCGFVKRTRSS